MLTVLFYVLLGLGAAHFIYERIILPSIRLHYRNQLFALRDVARKELLTVVQSLQYKLLRLCMIH